MKTKEEFVNDAKKIHGDKYDYSKVEYVNNHTKVCIICPKHGEFWQTPNNHLRGTKCPKCRNEILSLQRRGNKYDFIKKAIEVHGDKYDYSKVEYINAYTKVCIVCPKHGEFWITPSSHLIGQGCKKCYSEKLSLRQLLNTETFIERAKKMHKDRYNYSKVDYTSSKIKVCIICPKHGEFYQLPSYHLKGCGCPRCKQSKIENDVFNFLTENNISFLHNKHFKWLGRQHLDFYFPEYNVAVECQGGQHFVSVKRFGGDLKFEKRKEMDKIKYDLCNKNNIKIIYYTDDIRYDKMFDETIIHNKLELLNRIKNGN